jgi:L-iditol 2-dehydrogenase
MRVAVYYSNSDVRLEERPVPKIREDEILVKIISSGICGSDVMEWYRKKKAPLVPGHEVAGEVVQAGRNVTKYKPCDRVAVIHKVPCNTCSHCLRGNHPSCDTTRSTSFDPGGFSEYVRVPGINVDRGTYLLPESLDFDEATFIEPLSCAVRAQRLMGIRPGESVLVMGCGIAGLLNIRLAAAYGAGRIFATDISGYRLGWAERSGATPINAKEDVPSVLKELNGGPADKIMVCTGARQAALQSFRCIERGGTIMFFAVPRPDEDVVVPLNDFWTNEIRIMTSYYTSPPDMEAAISLLASGRVEVGNMITHRLPLEEIGEGFRLVADAGESMKVIIRPHGL